MKIKKIIRMIEFNAEAYEEVSKEVKDLESIMWFKGKVEALNDVNNFLKEITLHKKKKMKSNKSVDVKSLAPNTSNTIGFIR